ncbi:MAG: tRNA-(ms[2]io[6]A)-hydroxylase [Bacteroidia bacterium]|nr:tRNA-(ms[2]io[6]A)-hydroxylase [Bacteroidia bacterium]MCO5255051.1 tRNA-(ms[2]io[6]A)-hydroxylase [Bacteroidota bacterium]MCZ2129809.1 tRNA-(ms[2]io[6]A)-hydroxylase [Bacteroidia bacterium]
MLGLKLATDPRWVDIASMSLEEILTDHAWCEQKAATNGITVISKFSEFENMLEEVTPVIAEEWGHFRKVLKELKKRNLKLGAQRKDEYVNALYKLEKKGGSRAEALTEKLLICAMIEARSCERFRLLSLHIQDEALKEFYHEFMVSEAGHYTLFIKLAKDIMPSDYVDKRWQYYLDGEAEIMKQFEYRKGRIH